MRSINNKDLLYIKVIAESKNISKAAKKLFISQPSLSQALLRIEDEIGVPLFTRHHDGVKLTYVGEKYYIVAKEILDIYNDFLAEVNYIDDLKSGRLNLGIASFMGSFLLPKIIPDFIDKYPNIEIFIKEDYTANLENMVADASIDFAILHTNKISDDSLLNYDILHKDSFVIVTEKDHHLKSIAKDNGENNIKSIKIEDIVNEEFIVLNQGQGIRKVFNAFCHEADLDPQIILTTKNFETAKKLVSQGYGITLLPIQYTKMFDDGYDVEIYNLQDSESTFWYSCIATRPDTYISNITKVFLDYVKEYYKHGEPI